MQINRVRRGAMTSPRKTDTCLVDRTQCCGHLRRAE
jgi:hypothetical protein